MSTGFLTPSTLRRALMAAMVLALASVFAAGSIGDAAARVGGGGSFGSRGTRTFSVPPSTPTAPRSSAIPSPGFNQGYAQQGFSQQRPGFFSGGFGRGLLGGLVGAGLFGMLFGNGFGGGLGGLSSMIGLILQLGLLYLAFRFIMGFFRNRQPAYGGAGFGQAPPQGGGLARGEPARGGAGGFGFGAGAARTTPLAIEPADYTSFEQRLGAIQSVYGAEDVAALRRLTTPQMARQFEEELASNARQGQVNRLADIKLLQGDLSEAWREGGTDYATVAMRFSLIDTMVERASGRIVSGNASEPQVVTELWTFVRQAGAGPAGWVLSAIQQG